MAMGELAEVVAARERLRRRQVAEQLEEMLAPAGFWPEGPIWQDDSVDDRTFGTPDGLTIKVSVSG